MEGCRHRNVQCSTFGSDGLQQRPEETETGNRQPEGTSLSSHQLMRSNRHGCGWETHQSFEGTAIREGTRTGADVPPSSDTAQ